MLPSREGAALQIFSVQYKLSDKGTNEGSPFQDSFKTDPNVHENSQGFSI